MTRLHLATSPGCGAKGFDIHRRRETAGRQPNRPSPRPADAETVIVRLEEAGRTLLCLPRHGAGPQQTRHHAVAHALAGYGRVEAGQPLPSRGRIARMDQALGWIPLIPADTLVLRRIVGCRSLISPATERHLFDWHRLSRLLGADPATVRRWHAAGIDSIVAALNRDAVLARSWDRLR